MFATRHRLGRLGDARQWHIDQARNEHRAEQGQGEHDAGPADPLPVRSPFKPGTFEHEPVFIILVDLEADPETGPAVDFAGKTRVVPQAATHNVFHFIDQGNIRWRPHSIGFFQRKYADAFIAVQVKQQFGPHGRCRVGQRCARDGDDRNHLCCDLLGLWRTLHQPETCQPGTEANRNEKAKQEEGAPEQPAF
jgi:hypothetical protein